MFLTKHTNKQKITIFSPSKTIDVGTSFKVFIEKRVFFVSIFTYVKILVSMTSLMTFTFTVDDLDEQAEIGTLFLDPPTHR